MSIRKVTLVLIATLFCFLRLTYHVYAGVPTAEHYDVFIEAEDVIGSSGFKVVGPPRALGCSGGKMLSLWSLLEPGATGYFAKYEINIPKSEEYFAIVWAQGLDTFYSSPFHISIDHANLHFTESTAKIISSESRYGEDIVAHMMGPIRLNKGKHTLLVQINERRKYHDRAFNLVLDAIALSHEVPGQASVLQREVSLMVDCTRQSGFFSPMTDVSQGGIREVVDHRFWASLAPVLRNISTQIVRIDHIFDDSYYGVVERNESGVITYQWSKLDDVLTQIIASGAIPFFCLSYMPSVISKRPDPYLPPEDYREWKAVCVALVEHVKKRFNLVGLYYEVWNEPDAEEFWKGSQQDYFKLYKSSAEGITSIDPYAKVGGPATSHINMTWMYTFIDYIKREGLRLDFVSWHLYHSNPKIYAQQIRYVKDILFSMGFPKRTETIISEWNIRGVMHPDNDAFYNAGHTAGVLKIFQEEGLSKSFFFAVKDSPSFGALHGEWGMVTAENKAKPIYNLFQTYARLRGWNLRVTTTDSNVNAFATLDESALRVLIWCYDDGVKFGVTRPVRLNVCLYGTGMSRKKMQKGTLQINSRGSNLQEISIKSQPEVLESSMVNVNDYFEVNFEIENGGIEYIELNNPSNN